MQNTQVEVKDQKKCGTDGCVSIRIVQYNLRDVNMCSISGRIQNGLGENFGWVMVVGGNTLESQGVDIWRQNDWNQCKKSLWIRMVNLMAYSDYVTSDAAERGVLWSVRLRRRPKFLNGKCWDLVL